MTSGACLCVYVHNKYLCMYIVHLRGAIIYVYNIICIGIRYIYQYILIDIRKVKAGH